MINISFFWFLFLGNVAGNLGPTLWYGRPLLSVLCTVSSISCIFPWLLSLHLCFFSTLSFWVWLSFHAVLISLSVWTFAYLEVFHVSTCNLSMFIFPFSESGVPSLVYLFGLACASFWGNSTDGMLASECGRDAENGCVAGSGGEGRNILLGRDPWQWGPLSPTISWVDALNNDLSEAVAMHWKGNGFLFLYLKLKANWKMKFRGKKTLPFIFAKDLLI